MVATKCLIVYAGSYTIIIEESYLNLVGVIMFSNKRIILIINNPYIFADGHVIGNYSLKPNSYIVHIDGIDGDVNQTILDVGSNVIIELKSDLNNDRCVVEVYTMEEIKIDDGHIIVFNWDPDSILLDFLLSAFNEVDLEQCKHLCVLLYEDDLRISGLSIDNPETPDEPHIAALTMHRVAELMHNFCKLRCMQYSIPKQYDNHEYLYWYNEILLSRSFNMDLKIINNLKQQIEMQPRFEKWGENVF